MSELALIAAVAPDMVIGRGEDIPWRLTKEERDRYRPDIDRFRDLTTGHTVIMGRKTYTSIPEKFRTLPKRNKVVVSRTMDMGTYEGGNLIVTPFLSLAIIDSLEKDDLVWVMGGEELYRETIRHASRLEITEIHQRYEGDKFFPEIDLKVWREAEREDQEHLSFVTYLRM